jgi:hypothetical protein
MPVIKDSTTPIKDVIQSTLSQIKEGLSKDAKITSDIKFELSTVVQKDEGGKLDVKVVNYGGKVSEVQTQKITFSAQLQTDITKAQDAAVKAKAESDKTQAELNKITAENKIVREKEPIIYPTEGITRSDSDIGRQFGL